MNVASGEEIQKGWLFEVWRWLLLPLAKLFWGFDVYGKDNLPTKDNPAIFVAHHTAHSGDIHLGLLMLCELTGQVVRGLIHRVVIVLFPIYRLLGSVPGTRDTAIQLLRNGESVALIPGGAEELCLGHENAYTVVWTSSSGRKRCGFAHVAEAAGAPVIPIAGRNTEEMFFCWPAYLWNRWGWTRRYNDYCMRSDGLWGWILVQIRIYMSFWIHLIAIPIPVRVGFYVGNPLRRRSDETIEQFAQRCQEELQSLLLQANGRKEKRVLQALKERFYPKQA